MKRLMVISTIMLIVFFVSATSVLAFDLLSSIKSNAFAWIISGVIGISGIGASVMFKKLIRTMKESGEFMVTAGVALEDGKLDAKELADIFKQGQDVFDIWKKTPDLAQIQQDVKKKQTSKK